MYSQPEGTPPALFHALQHFGVLHENVVLLSVDTGEVPHVVRGERARVEEMGDGFYRVRLRYGFMEDPDVPEALEGVRQSGLDLDPERTTFFLGRETLIASRGRVGMALWREFLFVFMARNARTASSFFRLPAERVVELGTQIEI